MGVGSRHLDWTITSLSPGALAHTCPHCSTKAAPEWQTLVGTCCGSNCCTEGTQLQRTQEHFPYHFSFRWFARAPSNMEHLRNPQPMPILVPDALLGHLLSGVSWTSAACVGFSSSQLFRAYLHRAPCDMLACTTSAVLPGHSLLGEP